MKELGRFAFLLIATALLVLLIHGWLAGLSEQQPTYIYYEEEPTATATYDDSTNTNYTGWSPYPIGSMNYTNYTGPTPTPGPTYRVKAGIPK